MKQSDDLWKDIISLSSPTTNHFFQPPTPTTRFFPPPPQPPTTTDENHPCKRHKPYPQQPHTYSFMQQQPGTSSPEYSEKFRRLMKNRESAARSRARKEARASELEVEVKRLEKENARLKKMQKEVCGSHVPKESKLHRTKSAPF